MIETGRVCNPESYPLHYSKLEFWACLFRRRTSSTVLKMICQSINPMDRIRNQGNCLIDQKLVRVTEFASFISQEEVTLECPSSLLGPAYRVGPGRGGLLLSILFPSQVDFQVSKSPSIQSGGLETLNIF